MAVPRPLILRRTVGRDERPRVPPRIEREGEHAVRGVDDHLAVRLHRVHVVELGAARADGELSDASRWIRPAIGVLWGEAFI